MPEHQNFAYGDDEEQQDEQQPPPPPPMPIDRAVSAASLDGYLAADPYGANGDEVTRGADVMPLDFNMIGMDGLAGLGLDMPPAMAPMQPQFRVQGADFGQSEVDRLTNLPPLFSAADQPAPADVLREPSFRGPVRSVVDGIDVPLNDCIAMRAGSGEAQQWLQTVVKGLLLGCPAFNRSKVDREEEEDMGVTFRLVDPSGTTTTVLLCVYEEEATSELLFVFTHMSGGPSLVSAAIAATRSTLELQGQGVTHYGDAEPPQAPMVAPPLATLFTGALSPEDAYEREEGQIVENSFLIKQLGGSACEQVEALRSLTKALQERSTTVNRSMELLGAGGGLKHTAIRFAKELAGDCTTSSSKLCSRHADEWYSALASFGLAVADAAAAHQGAMSCMPLVALATTLAGELAQTHMQKLSCSVRLTCTAVLSLTSACMLPTTIPADQSQLNTLQQSVESAQAHLESPVAEAVVDSVCTDALKDAHSMCMQVAALHAVW